MRTGPSKSDVSLDLIIQAGLLPLVAAAIWGGLWLLIGPDFSGLREGIFWIIPIFAGWWYIYQLNSSGVKLNLIWASVHGVVLGGLVGVIYLGAGILAIRIRLHTSGFREDDMRLLADFISYAVPAGVICAVTSSVLSSINLSSVKK